MKHVRACAGRDAASRVALARAFLEAAAPGSEQLAIASRRVSLDELIAEITLERGATFGVHRRTLAGLATELAMPALAHADRSVATRLVAQALARMVTYEAHRSGDLPLLGKLPPDGGLPASQTPGFAAALARTLEELDQESLAPEQLSRSTPKQAELARLYQRFRETLVARGLASRADVLRAATSASAGSMLDGLPLVCLDLALRSACERDFLRGLLARAPRALLVFPEADLGTLRQLLAMGLDVEPASDVGDAGPLDPFRRRLFGVAEGSLGGDAAERADVTIISAPGEALEAVEVARRVLEEAERGVPLDEIAVLVRSRETYATHLATALARAAIPAHFEQGSRRPHPAGRALLALLACRAERGAGRRLFEYLSTAQMPASRAPLTPASGEATALDEDLGRFGADAEADEEQSAEGGEGESGATPVRAPPLRAWIAMLGEIGVGRSAGGESLAAWIERRVRAAEEDLEARRRSTVWEEAQEEQDAAPSSASAADERDDPSDRTGREIRDLQQLRAGLAPVLEALDRLPARAPWAAHIEALKALAARALRRPELVLALLGELASLASGGGGDIDLEEVVSVLSPRLSWLEDRAPIRARGRVLVTSPGGIRGRCRRVVIVPGLAEGMFPERPREDPLLLDDARQLLAAGLATAASRFEEQRLDLALAAGAARERLHFSYPRLEAEAGRSRVPSAYAFDVLRAMTGELLGLAAFERATLPPSRVLLSWPAPRDPTQSIDEVEYTLAVVRKLYAADPEAARGRARFLIERHATLDRALRSRWHRYDSTRFSEHDGFYARSPFVRALLSRHRLAARAYSPSALEAYAACPYRFYLRSLAGLTPRMQTPPLDRLDPKLAGDLYHRCQAALSRRLVELQLDPQRAEHRAGVMAELQQVVERVASKARLELDPIAPEVFDDEVEQIRLDLAGWVEQELTQRDGFLPFLAELSFGLPRDPRRASESIEDDVRIAGGYRLKGAIDSIERDAALRLRVTDYKTGRAPDERARVSPVTRGGEMLQPILYALAVEALKGRAVPEQAVVVSARLYHATRRGDYTAVDVPIAADNVARAMHVLDTIDDSVERGMLLALPREDACKHCAYRVVCGPNEEARSKAKKPHSQHERSSLEQLARVRSAP